MAKPNSRLTLIEYCMRALGAPVIEINVDEDQIEDRLDEALQFYQEYHFDATMPSYVKHVITADDISRGYITVADEIVFVNKVFPLDNDAINMFSVDYQFHLNDMPHLLKGGGMAEYTQMQQYMSLVNDTFSGDERTRFSRHQNRLYIDTDWSTLDVGSFIVVDASVVVDPEEFTDVYNDMYLKRYLTALIKRAWGLNLIKFQGVVLPGGITLNGRQIFDDASAEIIKLEEDMRLAYELPIDFITG